MKTLSEIQKAHKEWAARNFKDVPPVLERRALHCALGVCEEAGELAHAVLKADQQIRGDVETHKAAARDAVGDVCLYLMDLCNLMGWELEEVIREVAREVHRRDWNAEREEGEDKPPATPPGCPGGLWLDEKARPERVEFLVISEPRTIGRNQELRDHLARELSKSVARGLYKMNGGGGSDG